MGDGTTSIDDLPLSPQTASPNIKLNTKEMQNGNDANSSQDLQKQREGQTADLNQLINGIQQASAGGATALPSRDIPRNTESHMQDEQIKPNFVPVVQENSDDYIQNEETEDNLWKLSHQTKHSKDSLEILYEEFQIPIIIALLYFILQLPIVRTRFLSLLPSLREASS